MRINSLHLNKNHWSTEWIPISYNLLDTDYLKSYTFLWSINNQVLAIARAYHISKENVEIGDVWLNEKYRGQYYNNTVKYSEYFIKKIIAKIWKIYPNLIRIGLWVDSNNLSALNLYKKHNFIKYKENPTNLKVYVPNSIYMIRNKRCL